MKKNKYSLLLLAILSYVSIFFSCKDLGITENDITNYKITVHSPSDGLTTSTLIQTFWWDYLNVNANYNLQIVEGTFSKVTRFVADTTTGLNKFTVTLTPGSYQWRICALNGSSTTNFQTYSFTITLSKDLTTQTINITSPVNYDTTNVTKQAFTWDKNENADNYRFEIWSPDASGTNILTKDIDSNKYTYTLGEGAYQWRVRGQNSLTNTIYSTRTIFVDTTAPKAAIPDYPPSNDTILASDTIITFKWHHDTDNGSRIIDDIYIYNNSSATTPIKSATTSKCTFSIKLSSATYYWRIKSYDKAGNTGGYSTLNKFIRQ